MHPLEIQFRQHWQARFGGLKGPFLLALSGGIDSMVLAHLMLRAGLPFGVAHVNFQLRHDESDSDEALVQTFARKHQIACFTTRFATTEIAAERKISIQEAARELRYAWLEEMRAANGYSHILTAHHADDQAETLLINLLRGTGISGLHGIPELHQYIIRPLLFVVRADITEYAIGTGIAWREDASNATDKYLRNGIRHHVIPALQSVMPDAVERLNDNIRRFAEAEMIYDKAIAALRKKLIEPRGKDWYVPLRKLKTQHPLATICLELFRPFGFTPAQLPDVLQLLNAETGRYILSPSHQLLRNRDFLIVAARQPEVADFIQIDAFPATIHVGDTTWHFECIAPPDKLVEGPDIAFLDMSQMQEPLILRTARKGDYFYPLGMGMKKKKLSRFLIDQKVPLHEKASIRIVESNKRIAWIGGLRLDERFKCKPTTREVLRISIKKNG